VILYSNIQNTIKYANYNLIFLGTYYLMNLLPLNLNHRYPNHSNIIIYLHTKIKINPGLTDMQTYLGDLL